ncbi:hypothetical protein KM043_009709 [Ampulex compressa]|nr:hypothetical protein KM043_009709 [Ampulex compressa]
MKKRSLLGPIFLPDLPSEFSNKRNPESDHNGNESGTVQQWRRDNRQCNVTEESELLLSSLAERGKREEGASPIPLGNNFWKWTKTTFHLEVADLGKNRIGGRRSIQQVHPEARKPIARSLYEDISASVLRVEIWDDTIDAQHCR